MIGLPMDADETTSLSFAHRIKNLHSRVFHSTGTMIGMRQSEGQGHQVCWNELRCNHPFDRILGQGVVLIQRIHDLIEPTWTIEIETCPIDDVITDHDTEGGIRISLEPIFVHYVINPNYQIVV